MTVSRKELENWFREGTINEQEFREELKEIGYEGRKIGFIVESAKKPEKTEKYVSTWADEERIFEAITVNNNPVFLCYNPKNPLIKWYKIAYIPTSKGNLHPVKENMHPYKPYKFTEKEIEKLNQTSIKINIDTIYNKIFKIIDTHLVAEKSEKALITTFIIETYHQNKIESLSYLFFVGDANSGKSRTLELIKGIAYRSMLTTSLNEANVYEFIGDTSEGNCTILEDEAQNLKMPHNFEKMKIYRAGYRKGNTVPRILDGSSSSRKQVYYHVFCSKSFAGYYLPNDTAFKQRCISINMVWGEPEHDQISKKDQRIFKEIRKNLLIHRMQTYFDKLPGIDISLKGRNREVWESKLAIALETEAYPLLKSMALQNIEERNRLRMHSLEAYLIKTMLVLISDHGDSFIPFSVIWESLLKLLGMPDSVNKRSVQAESIDRKVTKHIVGRVIGSTFNATKDNQYGFGRVWKFDQKILNRLRKKYALTDEDLMEAHCIINDIDDINDIREDKEEEE
jgi:hypothetical protein